MDREAFRSVVEDRKDRVFSFAVYILHDAEDGRDVAQESFVRLWEHGSKVPADGAARALAEPDRAQPVHRPPEIQSPAGGGGSGPRGSLLAIEGGRSPSRHFLAGDGKSDRPRPGRAVAAGLAISRAPLGGDPRPLGPDLERLVLVDPLQGNG
ncbi:MAG: hypothetical protein OEQ13_08300 [Acidobacteriota bacterium]|nr:hypothetical protein [Acidobacteriota bacterium]